MKKVEAFFDKLWQYTTAVAGITLFGIILLIIANIIGRRFFNSPIYGSTEIIRYVTLVAAAFALAQNEWMDGNIRVTLLLEALPKKIVDVMVFVAYTLCSFGFLYVNFYAIIRTIARFNLGDTTPELGWFAWVFSLFLTIGLILLNISIVVKAVIYGYHLFTGAPREHAIGASSERNPLE